MNRLDDFRFVVIHVENRLTHQPVRRDANRFQPLAFCHRDDAVLIDDINNHRSAADHRLNMLLAFAQRGLNPLPLAKFVAQFDFRHHRRCQIGQDFEFLF